jgi:hypothetical protein
VDRDAAIDFVRSSSWRMSSTSASACSVDPSVRFLQRAAKLSLRAFSSSWRQGAASCAP